MIENVESTVPTSESEADELLSSIEEPSSDQAAQEPAEVQANQQAAQEYAFKVGGKEIKAPIEKIIRWAEMGYDAPTKIGTLQKEIDSWKQKESSWTQKESALKEIENKYKPIDEYARQNPQWLQHVMSQYEQAINQNPNLAQNPMLQSLQQKVEDLMNYKNQAEQARQSQVMQQEDSAYQAEIESIKKQYPKLDLLTPDETGKSLEWKVLQYANENGIRKFTTAFRDLYHDKLLEFKAEEAKEKLVKDKISKTKLGILGESPTPMRRNSDSVKGKDYNEIMKDIIEEYNLT